MFRKTDATEQLDLFTSPSNVMGKRAVKKYTDPNSWHNQFFKLVTSRIDEEPFRVLFPEGEKDGRPNAPIRVLVAMSVLKDGFGCSDESLFERCEFDLLVRKALGPGNLDDAQPSLDTWYLLRRRICEYDIKNGTDLMHECFGQGIENSEMVTGDTVENAYTDGAYQSPENSDYCEAHGMRLKTCKIQRAEADGSSPHFQNRHFLKWTLMY